MSMDLTGITNKNEYYTNHYFSTLFEDNASQAISAWTDAAREERAGEEEEKKEKGGTKEPARTPWALLRQTARKFSEVHSRYVRSGLNRQTLANIRAMADIYLKSLGYPDAKPETIEIGRAHV